MNQNINTTFTGSVDQLLEHCSKLEFDISEEQIKQREYELSLQYIMDAEDVNREEAIEIYNMIALAEVKETVDKLVKEGLLQVNGYDDEGEPKFELTELGKQCAGEIKKQEKIKKSKKKK
jgi:predicted transcriptional regulator